MVTFISRCMQVCFALIGSFREISLNKKKRKQIYVHCTVVKLKTPYSCSQQTNLLAGIIDEPIFITRAGTPSNNRQALRINEIDPVRTIYKLIWVNIMHHDYSIYICQLVKVLTLKLGLTIEFCSQGNCTQQMTLFHL